MGKRYDWQVTPQNTPRFRERRLWFLLAMAITVVDLVLIAILHADMRKDALICAVFVCVFACLQAMDNRKAQWGWGYIITMCCLAFLCSACFIFASGEYWYYAIWALEFTAILLTAYYHLKKERKGRDPQ